MVSSDLLLEGVNLMLFGMGFVFLFLTVLVGVTSPCRKWLPAFFQTLYRQHQHQRLPHLLQRPLSDTELVAAITAAIKMHRINGELKAPGVRVIKINLCN